MSVFFAKSLLSAVVLILAAIAMFTMFEVFGRSKHKYDVNTLMKIHRLIGRIYFVIFIIVTYYCLDFILLSKAELSPRSTLHGTLAISIAVLMGLKYLIIKVYREFYGHIKIIGILMVIFTFLMTGISGGYYMLVSKFGTDKSFDKIVQYKQSADRERGNEKSSTSSVMNKSEQESIKRGEKLFNAKCIFCHDPDSSTDKVGPGLKGIMKNELLPVSGRSADPVNVIKQLRKPFNRMPSFEYMSDEEVSDVLAYLKTL